MYGVRVYRVGGVCGITVDIKVRVCGLGSVSGEEDCMVCECMVGCVCEDFELE